MVSRNYYYFLIIRISFIAISSLLLFLAIFYFPNISLIIIIAGFFLYQVISLIRYLNKINTKLEDFFVAHLSGEVTTNFNRNERKDEFAGMYDYFNRLNHNLESARVRNEIQNNYFKTLVDHAAVGLISFTSDGIVEFFNDAAKRIFNVHVVNDLRKLDRFKEGLSDHLLHQASHHTDVIPIIIKGELIQLAIRKVLFKTDEKTIHLVSLQNIKPELEQKEIESWQRLIRVLTHEIMNSITPITSLVSSLTRMFRNKETGIVKTPDEISQQNIMKTLKGLDIVEGRGNGLVQFVQNYREVTRLPKPMFEVVNVKDLLHKIALLFDFQVAEAKIDLQVECHPSLLLQADGKLLEQVIINLVKNAIEAFSDHPSPKIRLSGQSQMDHVIIEVEDNGQGIPDSVLEDIFVPFFTTKEKGSGIGLSLSRQIIRLHGGSLDIQSSREGKTVFVIKI
jgi:two-component system, NtrC family, nitrogen regulation sensor histidine kinase NtrY